MIVLARQRQRGRRRPGPIQSQVNLDARVRFGPESRALQELEQSARDTRDFEVRSARGTAAGLQAAIQAAIPGVRRTYAESERSLAQTAAEVDLGGEVSPLMAAVLEREEAGADRRVAEAKAGDLADMTARKVSAAEGALYATNAANQAYRTDLGKIQRQKVGLAGDVAAFKLGAIADAREAKQDLAMERRRLQLAIQSEERQQRQTEADLTGIDPRTGQMTADERNRVRDDRRARENAKDDGKGGPTAGEKSKHQDIVADIQDAKRSAREYRRQGAPWRGVREWLSRSKSEDNPHGGYSPLVAQAGIELARYGDIRPGTLKALKARGLMPRRTPPGWRDKGGPLADLGDFFPG